MQAPLTLLKGAANIESKDHKLRFIKLTADSTEVTSPALESKGNFDLILIFQWP